MLNTFRSKMEDLAHRTKRAEEKANKMVAELRENGFAVKELSHGELRIDLKDSYWIAVSYMLRAMSESNEFNVDIVRDSQSSDPEPEIHGNFVMKGSQELFTFIRKHQDTWSKD